MYFDQMKNESRYLTPSGEIVSDGLLFSARWRNSKYTFYSLWFDQTGDCTGKPLKQLYSCHEVYA
jgi:hypothetical protein